MSQLKIKLHQGKLSPHIEVIEYPDGQRTIQLGMDYYNNAKLPVHIDASVRQYNDLELLCAVNGALQQADFIVREINFWYLFGLRSDRVFHPGQPNYLRDVIAPIIRRLPGNHYYFYPHGSRERLQTYLGRSMDLMGYYMVKDAIPKGIDIGADESCRSFIVDYGDPCFIKHRSADGDISVFLPPMQMKSLDESIRQNPYDPLIIKDDLCDGGATFLKIVDWLDNHYPGKPRYLFVAHGLFNKGTEELCKRYTGVITTNSYQDFADNEPANFKVIKVL